MRIANAASFVGRANQLEIDADDAQERRDYRLHRFGTALCAAFVAAALLGLTGPGWLSSKRVGADGYELRYSKNIHRHAESELELTCELDAAHSRELRVIVSDAWLSAMSIQTLDPEPSSSQLVPEGREWTFPVRGRSFQRVRIAFEPREAGRVTGSLAIQGGPALAIAHNVWP